MLRYLVFPMTMALAACGGPAAPDRLSVTVIGEPPVLRPPSQRAPGPATRIMLSAMAEGLVRFDANGLVEPGLAKRWIVIDDGKTFIFRLRRVEFAPGRRIVADDVAKLLRAAVVARTNRVADDLAVIDEITALTPDIVEITLKAQRPDLLQLLAQPEMAIVADRYGGGPFGIRSRAGETVLLAPKADKEPQPDDDDGAQVNLRGARAPVAIARFRMGLDDMVLRGTFNELPLAQAARVDREQLRIDAAKGIFGLRIERRDGLLESAEMRRAIAMAIDRTQLVASFGAQGWLPQQTLYPAAEADQAPVQFGFATYSQENRAAIAARTLKAVEPDSRRLTIALPEGHGTRLLFARLERDFAHIGVSLVRVKANERPELTLADRVADSTDPAWYIRESAGCWIAQCSEEIIMALEEMESQPTLAGWAAARQRAELAVMTDVPFIPIAAPLRFQLVSRQLPGFQPNDHAIHPLNKLLRASISTR